MLDQSPNVIDRTCSDPAWTAAIRLAEDFPTVQPAQLVEILIDARQGVDLFGLPRDAELAMTERIARERLIQLTTDPDARRPPPRLVPETHRRRTTLQ